MSRIGFALPVLAVWFSTVAGAGVTPATMPVAHVAPAAAPDDRLPMAVERGDAAAVEALLRKHVSVDSAEGDGMTALHWAAYQNNLALAELLLKAHANVNAKTRIEAATPLFMACQNGSAPMIELLLNHGASASSPNTLGTTPLMIAAESGNPDAVAVLLKHGADPNSRESAHQQTALMFAANLDRGDAIRVLIEHGADPNLQSKVTPVERPVRQFGNFNGNAADPTADASDGQGTARRGRPKDPTANAEKEEAEAVAQPDTKQSVTANEKKPGAPIPEQHLEVVTPDAQTAKTIQRDRGATMMGGLSPLHYAARQGNIAAAVALLDKGANINEVTLSEQSTPLVLAIANGHLDLAKVLVDRGADVNKVNVMEVAPLYATIDVAWVPHEWSPEPVIAQEKTSYLDLMKLLLDHGADPNARLGRSIWSRVLSENRVWTDVAGSTAFFRAAMADDVKAMQLLKDHGADPNIPTRNGTTPLMAAAGVGWGANYSATAPNRMAAVQYCINQGGKIAAVDDLGFTPLHGAAFVGDLALIQYFYDHGAKVDAKTKAGDTVADTANGPFEKSLPQPAAVALLVKLGASVPHNCRSSDCIPATKEDRPAIAGAGGGGRRRQQDPAVSSPDAAKDPASSKPAAVLTTIPKE
jgi:ankyrin repeat protein